MSAQNLRTEKNCLNCGARVEERFCPRCGQENKVNRPSFHHLFTHFFADLFHYDSGFWKTMRFLLFRPGILVREYLAGKRKTYVQPVRLYIFVSFITFFLPFVLPDIEPEPTSESVAKKQAETAKMEADFKQVQFGFQENEKTAKLFKDADTPAEFDSINKSLPEMQRLSWIELMLYKKEMELNRKKISNKEYSETMQKFMLHNLPKVLFFYLPVFAFLLWLFHGKKKWLYYDHGIFTLYYFSFLLLLAAFNILLNWIMFYPLRYYSNDTLHDIANIVGSLFFLVSVFYSVFYFFRSHSRIYGERKWVSRLKSLILFMLNACIFLIILAAFTVLTIYMN